MAAPAKCGEQMVHQRKSGCCYPKSDGQKQGKPTTGELVPTANPFTTGGQLLTWAAATSPQPGKGIRDFTEEGDNDFSEMVGGRGINYMANLPDTCPRPGPLIFPPLAIC